jgi:hypothetical protein
VYNDVTFCFNLLLPNDICCWSYFHMLIFHLYIFGEMAAQVLYLLSIGLYIFWWLRFCLLVLECLIRLLSGINLTHLWCIIFVTHCWIQFSNILLGFLHPMFMRDVGLQFSFLVTYYLILVFEYCSLPRVNLEMFPVFLVSGRYCGKILPFLS